MKKNLLIQRTFPVLVLLFLLLRAAAPAWAQTPTPAKTQESGPVYLYLFYGDSCPHCAHAKPYLESLAAANPLIILKEYEVYNDPAAQEIFRRMAEKHNLDQLYVPTLFVGGETIVGYSDELYKDVEGLITVCMQIGCDDPGLGIISSPMVSPLFPLAGTPTMAAAQPAATPSQPSPTISAQPTATVTATALPPVTVPEPKTGHILTLPVLGRVDLDQQSSLISTILIALVDGFNPCSLWVLTMLLALTLHTGSRKKVLFIGLIFLTVTAVIYALFIVGLFSVLKTARFMGWVRVVVALIALVFAVVNIKDYFWYKEGLSFTISDKQKPGLFQKMRAVMDASQSIWGMAGATVALAVGVSMVEFSCTAGFPVIWTNILTSQNVSGLTFVFLLLVYMLIYQLDELVIFFSSVATLKAGRIEEKHGRILKLISGTLMLTLGLVMLINPALMNDLGSSLMIFGAALLIAAVVLTGHRWLLPKCGVYIGSDASQPEKKLKESPTEKLKEKPNGKSKGKK